MAIYIFNLLAGCVRGGIDSAQGYRAQVLKEFSQPVKFVFTELSNKSDIYFYEHAGISVGQMLSMHLFLAGGQSLEVSANTEEKLAELKHILRYTGIERRNTEIRLLRDGHMIASILLDKQKDLFYAIHYYSRETRHRDIAFMDYGAEYNQLCQVFEFGKSARIMTFFHGNHYFEKGEDPGRTNLNYAYYYWFKHADQIDTMIVSTQEQRIGLIDKLKEYGCSVPKVEVIPVSGLSRLRFPERERKRYSLISVSRITPQKKVDWIVKSVIKAHRKNPNIFIDIYGGDEYGYRERLQDIVTANDAQSYIHFKGYMDVKEIYKEYEVYLSASLGETLGLTLMEAVGSGLGLIGLDVRYGNRQFIQPGKNGYLIPYDWKYNEDDDSELIDAMADKIVEIFENQDRLERFHQASYEVARGFSDEIIGEKWRSLFS